MPHLPLHDRELGRGSGTHARGSELRQFPARLELKVPPTRTRRCPCLLTSNAEHSRSEKKLWKTHIVTAVIVASLALLEGNTPTAAQDEPPPRVKVAALLNLPPVVKLGAPVL